MTTASTSPQQRQSGLKVYKRLLSFVLPYWPIFVIGIIATAAGSLVDATFIAGLRPILDHGLIDPNVEFIRWLPVIAVGAFFLRGGASFCSSYSLSWLGGKVTLLFRRMLFRQYVHMPTSFYDQTTSGALLSKALFNVDQITAASTDTIVTLLRESFFVIGLISVMLYNSWQLSLLFLLAGPVITITIRYTSKRLRNLSKRIQTSMGDVSHTLEEAIEGHRVVKAFGGQQYEIDKFDQVTQRVFHQNMKRVLVNSLATPVVQIFLGFIIAAIIFLATLQTGKINISPGAFVSMIASMLAILKPIKTLTRLNSKIQAAVAAAETVFELVDASKEPDEGVRVFSDQARGLIEYQQVGFQYDSNEKTNVLKDISFTIQPGQTVALVGRSGAGKSTIASLLPRFYHNYTGHIKVDGIDTRDYQLISLRQQIALVTQQVTLFDGTIRDNITYGQFDDVNETDMLNAARAAHILEFVEQLPDGLETVIGENGLRLSGGQRQRLAIARAILKNAPILVLDEATSSLDTEAERYIQDALDKLMKNRTTLVIAHRLSTVENADHILVLDRGRVVESGDHHTLLARDGEYARLYKMQFKDDLLEHGNSLSENTTNDPDPIMV